MNKNVLRVLRPVIHLEKDSPLLNQHHAQWRVKSIESYQARSGEDLHYSAVISLSREDYEWVREKISQVLETLVERIKDSKDEKLAALNLDWFEI